MKPKQATESPQNPHGTQLAPVRGKAKVTQKHVALAANVHNCTVSLALRDHPSLPLKTRRRIQNLARRLGYQADEANLILTAYRCGTVKGSRLSEIAVIPVRSYGPSTVSETSHEEILKGIGFTADGLGYKVRQLEPVAPEGLARLAEEIIGSNSVSGIIILGGEVESDLPETRPSIPIVRIACDRNPALPALCDTIVVDGTRDLQLIFEHLGQHEFRRVGLVTSAAADSALARSFEALGASMTSDNFAPSTSILSTSPEGARFPFTVPREEANAAELHEWLDGFQPDVVIVDSVRLGSALLDLDVFQEGRVALCSLEAGDELPGLSGVRDSHRLAGAAAVMNLESHLFSAGHSPHAPSTTYVSGIWSPGSTLHPSPDKAAQRVEPRRRPARA